MALRKQNELEDIIASINRDVLIVVDGSRTIIRCTASVKTMFDYDISEVLGRKIDVLYSLTASVPGEKHPIEENGAGDGFHLQAAMGNKKDGTLLNLEVVTYHRNNNNGSVLLVRDVTDRAKAQEELEKYRDTMEQVIKKRTQGWEVAEAVKSINKNVPVAIITGWNVDLKETEVKGRGVDLIAFKPFEVHRVLQLVQEGMELRERLKKAC